MIIIDNKNVIKILTRISKRLYTEDRLTGNEMRDMAQILEELIKDIIEE